MHVGIIIERFAPSKGGAERSTHDFAQWMVARGHRVELFSGEFEKPLRGAECHPVRVGRLCSRRRAPEVFAREAAEMVQRVAPAVVLSSARTYCHDVFLPRGGLRAASFYCNLESYESGVARLFSKVGAALSARDRTMRRLDRAAVSGPRTLVIALSRFIAGHLRRFYDVDPSRIVQIYNGIDTEWFDPQYVGRRRSKVREEQRIGQGDMGILFASHNWRMKGLATLIRSMATLKRKRIDAVLMVVGNGKKQKRFEAKARSAGVLDRMRFVGKVPDVRPFYGAADVCCHPTFFDACARVTMEAMAAGLPVITTRSNGSGEILTDGREGFIIGSASDDAALAEALSRLANEDRRRAMGQAARELALQYPPERSFRQIEDVLRRALAMKESTA